MPGGKIDILVEPDTRGFPSKLSSGLRSSAGIASSIGRGLGLAVAAGTAIAAVGLKDVIKLGNEYQGNLNELQAVSGATAAEMAKVGQTAKALGADMSLPATSAADAANAMVELAKGGLSVDEAMQAAKGTLQLAAAAQVDGATAAELQSAALNSFGLAADQAGRVADVLANTANASASSMIDVGNSLKYVAPVSAALKVSIEDTAAAIGLLANQGIKGEQAGTSLRGILASLASPSEAAAGAMRELGIQAFDTQGKFVGLRAFTDQLAKAKLKLTDADFAAAASTAFGNEGFTAANALAAEGAVAFDQMATSVSRAGGAADVAAAQTKGLGGAWEGFKSQLETAGIQVYEVIAPGLERGVRAASDFVAKFTPTVVSGIETATAAGALFGPQLAKAIASRADAVLDAGRAIIEPIADGIVDSLNSALNVGITVFSGFAKVVRVAADAIRPLAEGVGDLLESLDQAGGPVGALVAGLGLVYDVTAGIINVISPLVSLVGGLASAFGELPGPIQTAAIALLALRVGPAILGGLKNAFAGVKTEAGEASNQAGFFGRSINLMTAPVRVAASGISGVVGTIRQFGDEARVQRGLADQAGESIGRMGSFAAAFNTSAIPAVASARSFAEQTSAIRDGASAAGTPISLLGAAMGTLVERTPLLTQMRTAFQEASTGAERFGRTAGVAAAATTGLRGAASGLVSALGGPWGVALAGAGVALSLFAGAQQRAAQRAAENAAGQARYRDALIESNGALTEHIRNMIRLDLVNGEAAPALKQIGVSMDEAIDAITKGGPALDALIGKINVQTEGTSGFAAAMHLANLSTDENLAKQQALAILLTDLGGQYTGATQDQKDFANGAKEVASGLFGATDRSQNLSDAMAVLADETANADDKARALKAAMDALAGGTISLEQAQSRVNELLASLARLFGENLDKTKGWGQELLNADGSINTATENGRALLDTLDDLGLAMADVAQKTFDAARAQGDDIPTAMAKAQSAAQGVRDGFIAQGEALGLLPPQVQALADHYALIPSNVPTLINAPGMDSTQLELIVLKNLVDAVPPDKPIRVQSISEEAKAKLLDLGFTVRTLPNGQVEVIAQTQGAKDALAEVTKPRTVTITAIYRGTSQTAYGTMNPLGSYGNARGNIIAPAYANGGIHKLTPMKAGIATIVPPNTWRVVGDRIKDAEFYIPDDEAPRSLALGAEWARRRGFVLARTFASGGVATTGAGFTGSTQPPSVTVNMPVAVQDNRSAAEFARVASAEVAFRARYAG